MGYSGKAASKAGWLSPAKAEEAPVAAVRTTGPVPASRGHAQARGREAEELAHLARAGPPSTDGPPKSAGINPPIAPDVLVHPPGVASNRQLVPFFRLFGTLPRWVGII